MATQSGFLAISPRRKDAESSPAFKSALLLHLRKRNYKHVAAPGGDLEIEEIVRQEIG
jgi:hypothetical protein